MPSDDLCGSGQPLESIVKDRAAQHTLLAAAAASKGKAKAGNALGKPKSAIGKTTKVKKVFVFNRGGASGSTSSASPMTGRRRQNKRSPAW